MLRGALGSSVAATPPAVLLTLALLRDGLRLLGSLLGPAGVPSLETVPAADLAQGLYRDTSGAQSH